MRPSTQRGRVDDEVDPRCLCRCQIDSAKADGARGAGKADGPRVALSELLHWPCLRLMMVMAAPTLAVGAGKVMRRRLHECGPEAADCELQRLGIVVQFRDLGDHRARPGALGRRKQDRGETSDRDREAPGGSAVHALASRRGRSPEVGAAWAARISRANRAPSADNR